MPAIIPQSITKVKGGNVSEADDMLAAEEPLEISLEYGPADRRIKKNLSITMRTPGNDAELAVGFLFTEGIISNFHHIKSVQSGFSGNEVCVSIDEQVMPDMTKLERHFYTTSSCGVCGKSSIDAVRTVCNITASPDSLRVSASLLHSLPDILRSHQDVFESTGGLHASALFSADGRLLILREDVGRHNALDKLIGVALEQGLMPLNDHILLLSGRASFELIQKATMAGIKMVAAVGAPSSLAAQLASESNMTLVGFLRRERFNIYTGKERIIL
ncbi:MAG: formate dehydrogenase accessory sulfurtransferase FdhD [Sphingobacteriales bacterium]|nr:MAG: formate dehydrogenase accessory sulfurtransferase FdhD [Sphingobacteriales bacterium]